MFERHKMYLGICCMRWVLLVKVTIKRLRMDPKAWDKGPTAEVESSHGRFNPTSGTVENRSKAGSHSLVL